MSWVYNFNPRILKKQICYYVIFFVIFILTRNFSLKQNMYHYWSKTSFFVTVVFRKFLVLIFAILWNFWFTKKYKKLSLCLILAILSCGCYFFAIGTLRQQQFTTWIVDARRALFLWRNDSINDSVCESWPKMRQLIFWKAEYFYKITTFPLKIPTISFKVTTFLLWVIVKDANQSSIS